MRLGIIFWFGMTVISCAKDSFVSSNSESSTVYICKGAYSKSYHHDAECKGLRTCTTEISKTSIEFAQKKGRTLCGYEQN